MMNRLSHTSLEHKCLQPTFKKVLHSKRKHVIELVLTLVQKPIPIHSPHKSLTLKDPTRVLLLKRQKHSCGITNATQRILHSPKLPLASKTILSHKLQLSIQSFLLVRTTGLLKSLTI
ncbi:hypothetical protein HanPSC8_Chr13g0569411 [Helianthus annuus]|nr:hypothetical protein HanPSC8_Chr13g0569411 [Helianthus annuus]